MLTRVSTRIGVPPQELKNVLLLFGFAVISGLGLYFVRGTIPHITFEYELRAFQFSLAYVLLGLLPVLFSRAAGTEGKSLSLFLIISIVIGLWIQPRMDMINLVSVLLVMIGGFTYYGVYSGASNRELLLLIGVIIFQGYLFSMYYMWRTLDLTGNLRLTALTMLYLTGALIVIARLIGVEYTKATAGSGLMP